MTSRAVVVACAVGLAGVLVGDAVLVARRSGRHQPRRAPSELEGAVPALASFVARARGLRFRSPVRVELRSDADFARDLEQLRRRTRSPGPPTDVLVGLFRALGLVEDRFDPSLLDAGTDDQVLGFYDSGRKRLLVRADRPTPAVRRVLVHELTHALDDQYFDVDGRAPDPRADESALAWAALVEGDAVAVETGFVDSLSPPERMPADGADAGDRADAGVPRIFQVLLAFPYTAGQRFVAALVEAGGTRRVDAAFVRPPTTTEEVLHPERFLAGSEALPVAAPPGDGDTLDRGVLGELLLRLVLRETLDQAVADRAADGWGGDRYVAWADGARTCVRDRLAMDTPADRAELVAALRQWAVTHPGTTVDEAEAVTLTRCA